MGSTPQTTPAFTAAQIAQALQLNVRVVRRRLESISATVVVVKGQPTKAWALSALPPEWQAKLTQTAHQLGCRSTSHLLSLSLEPWQPPVPLAKIAPESVERAAKLQRALATPLAMRNDTRMSSAEFEALGLRDYRAAFGYEVTARHWRELVDRTLARDGGRNDFGRLEIYLDEKPALAPELPRAGANEITQHLQRVVLAFGDTAKPSDDEIRLLWHEAFSIYQSAIAHGEAEKPARRTVLRFLLSRPYGLAKNMASLRKTFASKFELWQLNEGNPDALKDRRKVQVEFQISQSDFDVITERALMCGGRLSQAWRELRQSKALSSDLLALQPPNASKSFVPHAVRAKLAPEIKRLMPYHRSPREHILSGPSHTRDYTEMYFGDQYQADDTTLPVRIIDPLNPNETKVIRGQLLVINDVATLKILGFVFTPNPQYTANHIVNLSKKAGNLHGLPKEFYYERGMWAKAKKVKGSTTALSEGEIRLGLEAEFGIKFVHARLPRGKVVEGIIRLIQTRMERLTGYVGRDERYDRFERVQKHKLLAERGKTYLPDDYFMSAGEWDAELKEIVRLYNNEPQEGHILRGLSPNQAAIERENKADPQIRPDARWAYLWSHYKEVRKVQPYGIRVKDGQYDEYTYCNAATGRLVGEHVILWQDLEDPTRVIITDLNRKNPIVVPRVEHLKSRGEAPEKIASEQAKITDHLSYARDRYHIVKPTHMRRFRENVISADVIQTGEEIERQTVELQERQQTEAKHAAKARKYARQAGVEVVLSTTNPGRQADALETFAKLKAKHATK